MTARRKLSAREVLDRSMLEDRGPNSLERWLVDLVDAAGALAYHSRDSRRDRAGFPDWTIVTKDGRIIFVELKTETGKLRPDQITWRDRLLAVEAKTGGRVRWIEVRPSTREPLERLLL